MHAYYQLSLELILLNQTYSWFDKHIFQEGGCAHSFSKLLSVVIQ